MVGRGHRGLLWVVPIERINLEKVESRPDDYRHSTPCPSRSQKYSSTSFSPRRTAAHVSATAPFATNSIATSAASSPNLECQPVVIGGVEDHVHLLCALARTCTAADLVKETKRSSSIWLKT